MEKEQVIIYIDAKGVEHTALLVAKDQRHEGFVSLVYINGGVAQRLDSVVHESDPSKDEANPDLKRIALNCWKEALAGPDYSFQDAEDKINAEQSGAPLTPPEHEQMVVDEVASEQAADPGEAPPV